MTDRANRLHADAAVTAAYWPFMPSDGALHLLVLLYFHGLRFSQIQLAWLSLLSERDGVITNPSTGWLAARFGLPSCCSLGLA